MSNEDQWPSEFVTRLMSSQVALYGYVVSLMGGFDQANDVLQETNLKLLRKARLYDPEQPFLRWAYAFARNEVLSWRTRQVRSCMVFDDELVNRIREVYEVDEEPERRLAALEVCIDRLPERQRMLVTARYGRGEALQAIASENGMQENATAALFYRVRKSLARCVEMALGKEVSP